MPKVLFTASTYGHLAAFHRPYLQAFRDMGWQVHTAAGGELRPLPEASWCGSLPFEKKMTAPANFAAQRQLRELMEQQAYDLICTHTSLAAFFTRRAAAGLSHRPPLVNMAHGYLFDDSTPPLKKTVLLAAERLTAPQTDLLLTMNRYDYDEAVRRRLGRRMVNIPGVGVNFSPLDAPTPADRIALRRRLDITESDFLLIYAAEFSSRKHQSTLIDALSLLPDRVKLCLAGSGALLEDCKAQAHCLGVADRVRFPGFVSDMPVWYAAADGAVTSSRSEGLPFNVMESMYCGLPVVATAVKGHTDLIDHGRTGLLYPFGDAEGCAARIRRLLEEPGLAAALGEAARASMAPYSLPEVLPRVMELYCSVLPERLRPRIPVPL